MLLPEFMDLSEILNLLLVNLTSNVSKLLSDLLYLIRIIMKNDTRNAIVKRFWIDRISIEYVSSSSGNLGGGGSGGGGGSIKR